MMFHSQKIIPQLVAFTFSNNYSDLYSELSNIKQKCYDLKQENIKLKKIIEEAQKKSQFKKNPRKKKRRSKDDLEFQYKCPYEKCKKEYASEFAINLHIKTKHNGGTKTSREALAKDIMLAQEKGDEAPEVTINFPPGYLKEFKKRFFNQK